MSPGRTTPQLNLQTLFFMDNSLPERLRSLLAQLTKLPFQIEQEVETLMSVTVVPAALPIIHEPVPPQVDKVSKVESELEDLWQQIEIAKSELGLLTQRNDALNAKNDELATGLSQCEDAIWQASETHRQLLSESEAARVQIHRFNEEQSQITACRSQYEAVIEQAARAQRELDAREQNISANESLLAQREQTINERAARLDGTRYWLESLLPSWLQEENIAPWRDAMMEDAQNPSASSTAAGLLFANLSLYTYAQRDTDARAVADALRDVGRRLFAWLKERNMGEYDASNIAQAMAAHINRECAGRCELEVPVPGTPAQNQSMLYQPRPGVSAQSVLSVQSWCVRGAKREVIHRATVTV
jgi:regulator of replication initiation timing